MSETIPTAFGFFEEAAGPSLARRANRRPVAAELFENRRREIAAGIYDGRHFDRLPILADALEDAGCDHADILAHCRGDGPHVRGCWVVDLVLSKM